MQKLSIFLLCAALLISCSKNVIQENPAIPQAQGKISKDNTDALQRGAFNLFRQSNKHSGADKNVIISPLSIQYALGMADNGARGNTLSQLMSVNGQTSTDLPGLNDQLAYLFHYLIKDKTGLKFNVANGVFYDGKKFTINNTYFEALNKYYSPKKEELDFGQKENVLSVINGWVNNQTNGRIEKVLEDITPEEFLFLINAIYMKADWDQPFPSQLTFNRNFTNNNGVIRQVPFISNTLTTRYLHDEVATIVTLPLGKGTLEAMFISPEKMEINQFINNVFDQAFISKAATSALETQIQLSIPKFKLKQHFDLKAILQGMGVTDPFEQKADFSGIGAEPGKVYLTRALHDVFMQLDEKGLEGAAVTTIGVGNTSVPPSAIFDKPFLFVVYDKETKTNIFIGKVADPALAD